MIGCFPSGTFGDDARGVDGPEVVLALFGGCTIKEDLETGAIGGGSNGIPMRRRCIGIGSALSVFDGDGFSVIEDVVAGEAVNEAVVVCVYRLTCDAIAVEI